jgi:uncharacterized protein (TIGR00725 family)
MKKLQIGVIGTFADKDISSELMDIAKEVGKEIAKAGHLLFFGPELDGDSIPTRAALGAKSENGQTVGILYGSKGNLYSPQSADIVIWTGVERGGPRESVLALSCDGLIAISGGSGTMTEMLIAYMNKKPVVVIEGTGGWADKMTNKFFDHRERSKAIGAKTPKEAVKTIIEEIKKLKS